MYILRAKLHNALHRIAYIDALIIEVLPKIIQGAKNRFPREKFIIIVGIELGHKRVAVGDFRFYPRLKIIWLTCIFLKPNRLIDELRYPADLAGTHDRCRMVSRWLPFI